MGTSLHRPKISAETPQASGEAYLYELRRYRVASGRLQDETARALACIRSAEEGGLGLFERYGIPRPVGLWTALCGPHLPCVAFLYQWRDAGSRAEAFETFYRDPQWNDVRAETNNGTEIVDRLDDLLLVGPDIQSFPKDLIYRISFSPADTKAIEPIISLTPLCGEDARDLKIIGYPTLVAAVQADEQAGESSLICELTHAWPR